MKSLFVLLLTLLVLIVVVGSGISLFYLTKTSEFERVENTPPPSSPVLREQ